MAPKKKADMPDDAQNIKDKLAKNARDITKAADRLKSAAPLFNVDWTPGWTQTVEDVDAMDKAFGEEEVLQKQSIIDLLRQKYQHPNAEVRVLRVGPNGRFVDITEDVKTRDGNLAPEDFVGLHDGDTEKTYPISRNPKNREEAMNLLREIIPGLKTGNKPESVQKMEKVLEESEKTLNHWKE
jgi:hypothetical protein